MPAFNDIQLNKKSFSVPPGVTLRECSVVIIGSTCKICGRDFKCESDVSVHSRWRHNGTIGSLIDDLHHDIYLENIGQKCDICDVQFQTISDLKSHKRLIHKHGTRSKFKKKGRRKETVRVKFKLNGMTTMDVNLHRKYLKIENNLKYFVDTGTQTLDSLEIQKHQDNCAAHIDLFLSDHVVDNNHVQHIPHKAANRYIVGKFTSTKGDAIARSTTVVGRSLSEISNTSYRDVIPDSNGSCEEYENHNNFISQENTADTWRSFLNNLDTYNKENSQRNLNESKRKNVYCQAEFLSNDNNPLTYQREKFDKTSLTSKQLSANEIRYNSTIKQSNMTAKDKRSAELINSLTNSEEIAIENEKNKIYETATKHSLASLTRSFFNKKNESIKGNSNVDDDIQEVLRITRRNVQSDINHESPNRTERELLVQNTGNKPLTYSVPIQRESAICPEKCNAGFTTNFEPSDYPAFTTVTESSYQFLANAFNKKLGIYLEEMHHFGISYYDELTEINNNNLEDYAIYAHQGFFKSRMQAEEP